MVDAFFGPRDGDMEAAHTLFVGRDEDNIKARNLVLFHKMLYSIRVCEPTFRYPLELNESPETVLMNITRLHERFMLREDLSNMIDLMMMQIVADPDQPPLRLFKNSGQRFEP